jgi:hypothetical protein
MIQVTGKAATLVATEGGLCEVANSKKEFDELKDPEWDEEAAAIPFRLGDTVKHKKFGRGMVIALTGSAEDLKVTVSFPNHGKKQLLAKLAKLVKID